MKIDINFRHKDNPKEYNRLWRKEYNRITHNLKRKLSDYKYMDRKNLLPICDYSYNEFSELLLNSKCHYCGKTENLGLDRIDNTGGHTKNNTIPCCINCNTLRGNNYTVEEMKRIVYLLRYRTFLDNKISSILSEMRNNKKQEETKKCQ